MIDKTPLRNVRKILQEEVYPHTGNSLEMSKAFKENINLIIEDTIEIILAVEKKSNFRMIWYEMIIAFSNHCFQSVCILYRALIISFCCEYLNLSKTEQFKRLDTFSKGCNELMNIFDSSDHVLNGMK